MTIPFRCPHCNLQTEVDIQFAGKSGPCAGCGNTVVIPSSSAQLDPQENQDSIKSKLGILAVIAGLIVFCVVVVGLLVAISWPTLTVAQQQGPVRQLCDNLKKNNRGNQCLPR